MRNTLFILLFPFWCFAQQPNVIFILADDLGWSDISYYGTEFETPRIDSLFTKGTKFSRFYSNPVCSPSRGMAMTSRFPYRLGMEDGIYTPWDERGLPSGENEYMFPAQMRKAGYQTAMFGKWHLGHAHPEHLPHVRGFDHAMYYSIGVTYFGHGRPDGAGDDKHDYFINGQPIYPTGYSDIILTDSIVSYLDQIGQCENQPFFMYVPFFLVHSGAYFPLGILEAPTDTIALAPGGYSTQKKTRWAMLKILDSMVGRIEDKLEELGIAENTIIVFTSDNGADVDFDGDNSPWTGEKNRLWEGGIHVPAVWYQKGTTSATTIDSIAGLVDIMPTVVEGVLNRSLSEISDSIDGINLYPLISGSGTPTANRYFIPHLRPATNCWAILQNNWKLVNNPDQSTAFQGSDSEDIRLYNLDSDPTESTDVSGSNTSVVTALQAIITTESSKIPSIEKVFSEPGNWNAPGNTWAHPKLFYNSSYIYYRE